MVTSRDRLHLVFTHPTRLGRGGHSPTDRPQAKYPISGNFCNESQLRYRPVTINTIGSPRQAPMENPSAGSSFTASVASGPPSRVQARPDPDLLREPSGHIAPDRGPLRAKTRILPSLSWAIAAVRDDSAQ